MHAAYVAIGAVLLAQAPAEQADPKTLYSYYARQAADYELFLDTERQPRLEFKREPVLVWTNAEGFFGGVFVWTWQGRPEVIGCVGSRQTHPGEYSLFHELHSLGQARIKPARFGDGKRTWRPAQGGIELADVEDAPQPGESPRRRLTQMRNLAREFTGWMQQDGDVTELRLLPQPIFRYQAAEQGVQDGAIFALVWKGTDPDVLLLLESRQVDGNPRWQYGLARFNWREMWVKRNDREVWRVAMSGLGVNSPYISGGVGKTTLAAIREAISQE